MSPRSDIPEPWRSAMENTGLYSSRALAEKARLGTTTVTGLVYGRRQSDEQTIQAVADALRLPVTTIREWAAQALGEAEPFELPPEANRLSRRQREALVEMVRAMVNPEGESAEKTARRRSGRGELVDLARPPAPDLSRVAARRGTSEGRRRREAQDRDAEPQDPSHPPHP